MQRIIYAGQRSPYGIKSDNTNSKIFFQGVFRAFLYSATFYDDADLDLLAIEICVALIRG